MTLWEKLKQRREQALKLYGQCVAVTGRADRCGNAQSPTEDIIARYAGHPGLCALHAGRRTRGLDVVTREWGA